MPIIKKVRFFDKHRKKTLNDRQRKMLNELFDGLEGNLTSSKWAKMCKCSTDTSLRDIQELLTFKMLGKMPSGGRNTAYVIKEK
jgi:Fic family protein